METTIIILAYIGNVFLNRWLNKLTNKKFNSEIIPVFWFIPLIAIITLLCGAIKGYSYNMVNWFTGKNWKR